MATSLHSLVLVVILTVLPAMALAHQDTEAPSLRIASSVVTTGLVSTQDEPVLKTDREIVNYAIGVNLINTLKQQGLEIDLPLVLKGMQDAHAGKTLLLDDAALARAMREYQAAVRQKQSMKTRISPVVANKTAGEKFLEENRKKPGVAVTPSGLQYKVLKEGGGSPVPAGKAVEFSYRALLLNGKEVGASSDGKPAVHRTNNDVIPGLDEALHLMRPGSKWQLFIPSALAYGEKGDGRAIGPAATVIYEVELIGVVE